jgi:hypothetical protein
MPKSALTPDTPEPDGMLWEVQVDPPSVVATMLETPERVARAEQADVDGHVIAPVLVTPDGRVWLLHVVPPSVVAITAPLVPAA